MPWVQNHRVSRLAADPRTASMEGSKEARPHLDQIEDRLLREVRVGEVAEWFALSMRIPPVLVVMTDARILLMSVLRERTQVLSRPFTVEPGKERLIGHSVVVVDTLGNRGNLLLTPQEVRHLQLCSGRGPAAVPGPSSEPVESGSTSRSVSSGNPPGTAVSRSVGPWNWGRAPMTWRDAEVMAGDHMIHLGFKGVVVTQGVGDGGLDVVADSAAAQVKYQAAPTGSPDVQRFFGASQGFSQRLFYAGAYTPRAVEEAERLGIVLFAFTPAGGVLPVNEAAHSMVPSRSTPAMRTMFGTLTFESRRSRAVGWANLITRDANRPVSDRRRKGARQLAERKVVLDLLQKGLAQLADCDNTLYKQRRRERTLAEAEKTLKAAAQKMGTRLH